MVYFPLFFTLLQCSYLLEWVFNTYLVMCLVHTGAGRGYFEGVDPTDQHSPLQPALILATILTISYSKMSASMLRGRIGRGGTPPQNV